MVGTFPLSDLNDRKYLNSFLLMKNVTHTHTHTLASCNEKNKPAYMTLKKLRVVPTN